MKIEKEFWKNKTLIEMTAEEWEALCDGCGICCLYKIEDEETGKIELTNVACRFLDADKVVCQMYEERFRVMPTCINLTPEKIERLGWLPETCAYRLVLQGKALPSWHPLISGDPSTVHSAGVSVKGKIIPESDINMDDLEKYVIEDG